jgi:hypothetical protein
MGSHSKNDIIPPVTTCVLDPPEPDGENSWYVSNVTIILNATDDSSGVNITTYRIDDMEWQIYREPFFLGDDGAYIRIEFYSVDNAGNEEPINTAFISIDQTKPVVLLYYNVTGGDPQHGWDLIFYAIATDAMSSTNQAEFYIDEELQKIVTGPGPNYELLFHFPSEFLVRGFIRNPEITDEYVQFFAFIVKISGLARYPNKVIVYDNAGNWDIDVIQTPTFRASIKPGFYLFQNVTLPNNYTGYIGRFFIHAIFNNR